MSGSGRHGRRAFLTGGLVGGAAGIVGASAAGVFGRERAAAGAPGVVTGQQVRWRLASSFPQSLDTLHGAGVMLAERVAALTGGAFRIEVFQAGELVPALQELDAVQKGSVEVGQTASYYYRGKAPALAFDSAVPFGLNARQQAAWQYEGGGIDAIGRIYDDFGIVHFPAGNTGCQMGGWFKRPIRSVGDLEGLKMRIPGLGGAVMDRLGVAVQNLAGGEVYTALERGALDATEWVGPYDDEKLGFYREAKVYHYPGWWEPGPSMVFLVNRRAWDALPLTYQEAFRAASEQAGQAMTRRYDALNPPALKRLLERGIQLEAFPDDVMRAARDAAESVLEDEARSDGGYAKLLADWRKFRAPAFDWFGTAELGYARFAFAPR